MTSRDTNFTTQAFASREVIICAGPIFSSNILHVSGVGPAAMLYEAGVPLVSDLPGVGTNFQDHPTAFLAWDLTHDTYPNPQLLYDNATFNAEANETYYLNRTGPYIQARGNSAAFLSLQTIAGSNFDSLLSALQEQDATSYLPSQYSSSPSLLAGYEAQHALLLEHLASPDTAMHEYPFAGLAASGGFRQLI